ncbi:signal recognition particle receptor beta subunit-domain-containing protein [Dipodascopsis tothii]|uniref:signal recognition particle receptor beta subunit-domain-containing protein n=1 Tax=Dipodascopsis tothii TaxID=44089 RepID=UPI0034CE75C9
MAGLPVELGVQTLLLAALVAAAVAMLVAKYLTATKASKGPTFLIAGPQGAGKTALFTLLRYGRKAPTVTSVQTNSTAQLELPGLPGTRLVLHDTAGHPKLRQRLYDLVDVLQPAESLLGVVFVVDASAMARPEAAHAAAQYLYDILALTERRRGGASVLVAANKAELFTAVPAKRLRSLLEDEITKIARTKARAVSGVERSALGAAADDDDAPALWAGAPGAPFRFEVLESEVTALSGSVETGKIEPWVRWMEERVVQ